MERTFVKHLNRLLKDDFKPEDVTCTVNIIGKFTKSFYYDDNTKQVLVSIINKLLSHAPHRLEAFGLINTSFFQFPNELVFENYVFWISYIFNKETITLLKIQVLTKIISSCSGIQEFDKYLHTLLPRIIGMCLVEYDDNDVTDGALKCLKLCIQKYPGPFVHSKSKIELSLCKFVTLNVPAAVIKRVGSVFQSLQEVGSGGGNQKINWTTQLYKLCSTLHKVYDDFLTGTPEFVTYNKITIPPYDYEVNNEKIPIILRNLTILINCMVVEKFSHPKTLLLPLILDVVKRGLMVDVYEQHKQSRLAMLLYTHQTDLLYLLRSLMACFKKDWIPFCSTITKLIIDCHLRTQKKFFFNKCEYQVALYKVLSYWIYLVNDQLDPSVHHKILSLILCSVKMKNGRRKLRLSSVPRLSKSEKICVGALETCRILVETVNLELDKVNCDLLFQTVTQTIVSIQGGSVSPPYTHIRCVIALYKVLSSIFTQVRYRRSPFIEVAINILTKGQNSFLNNNSEIAIIQSNMLEKTCQPLFPPLSLPAEVDQHKISDMVKVSNANETSDTKMEADSHQPSTTIVSLDEAMDVSDDESSIEVMEDVLEDISSSAPVQNVSVHIVSNNTNHIDAPVINGDNLEVSDEELDESDVIRQRETEHDNATQIESKRIKEDRIQQILKQLEVEELSENELLLNSFNNIVNSY